MQKYEYELEQFAIVVSDEENRFALGLEKHFFFSFASLTFPLAAKTGNRIFNVSSSSSSLIDCHFLNNDRQFYQKYLKTFVFQFENLLKIHF